MFCPKCDSEILAGLTICPDCHATLVDRTKSTVGAAITPDDSWVEVGAVRTVSRAETAKKALDATNIPSVTMSERFMSDHAMTHSEYSLPGPAGELTLIMVPREYRDDAEVVVETVLGDDFIPLDEL